MFDLLPQQYISSYLLIANEIWTFTQIKPLIFIIKIYIIFFSQLKYGETLRPKNKYLNISIIYLFNFSDKYIKQLKIEEKINFLT